jgi:hypothetical protein
MGSVTTSFRWKVEASHQITQRFSVRVESLQWEQQELHFATPRSALAKVFQVLLAVRGLPTPTATPHSFSQRPRGRSEHSL